MAEITLDDIMKAPTDHEELAQHLLANGFVQPPPGPVEAPPTVAEAASLAPMRAPSTPKSEVAEMTPPSIEGTAPTTAPDLGLKKMEPVNPARGEPLKPLKVPHGALDLAPVHPNAPAAAGAIPNLTAPDLGATGGPTAGAAPEIAKMTPPNLTAPTKEESIAAGKREYAIDRPQVTAPRGTKEYDEQKLAQNEYDKAHPWGSEISAHPGLGGKIGHVLGQIGQIGAMAVAPGLVANLPGNMFSRELESRGLASDLERKNEQAGVDQERQMRMKEAQARLDREGNNQSLVTDPEGNVTGWKSGDGKLHSMEEEGTPQAIKDIAEETQNKPHYEKSANGDIVQIIPGKNGEASKANVVYKGQPGQKTETRSIVGPDGKAHDKIFDVTPGSANFGKELADLGRAKEDKQESPTAAIQKEKAGERVVLAYDKDNKAHLMSRADAEEEGMTHITAASSGDIDKAKTHHVVLNTLQTQLNSVVNNSKALDQGKIQRVIIASALAHPSNTTFDELKRAAVLSEATEETKAYVQSVLALREAGLALPKEITGGSRVAEIQASALWQTMPSASSLNSDYAIKQAQKFQKDIDRLRERAPEVRGQTMVDPDEAIKTKGTEKQHTVNGPAAGAAPAPPKGKVTVLDTNNVPHFVNEAAVEDFLKDPKYKGWKRAGR